MATIKSIEEKAKAYDNIIEKANKMHSENCEACQMCIEELIPELAESEDEKIRKDMINTIKQEAQDFPSSIIAEKSNKWIAWLEKQGKQKPTKNIVETWKEMRLEVYQQASGNRHEPNCSDDTTKMFSLNDIDEIVEKMSEQKPVEPQQDMLSQEQYAKAVDEYIYGEQKPAWSEEDEDILNTIINHFKVDIECTDEDDVIRWLKSLRPQNTWKPSDEQMDALHYVTNFDYGGHKATLVSLYEQLKKLREE